jgi:hypothetical protein
MQAGAAQQGQRLLEVVPGLAHLAQLHVRLGQQAVPVGPLGRRDVAAPQCAPEGGLRLPEPAAAPVELPQPDEVAVQLRRVGLLDQPVGGGPEVLDVGVERGDVREGLARVGQQAGEVGGVAPAHLGLLGRVGGQPLGGVLAQQLVHAVAPVLAHLDQGVVDQAGRGSPAPATAAAASRSKPPRMTERRARAWRSPSPSSSQDQSSTEAMLRWRGSTSGAVVASSSPPAASRSAMAAGEAERTQRAASSMASGTPATSRQTRPTAARSAAGRNPGRSSRARSSNSWTAG